MDLKRWAKIEEIFQAALDRPSDSRGDFIKQECDGDDELRAEIQKLIARYETEETFLESPVWTDSRLFQSEIKKEIASSLDKEIASADQRNSYIGRRVGAYELVDEIGKGGMGVVYLGERADGEFKQRVAIKLIKRGMDTDFIIKRFRHERQILATLNHPNIARLFDGGTTFDDSPYFAMEYIEGKPLFKFCKKNNLDLSKRLKIFREICAAVAYAHSKQIVHRDIKPGNILVTADGTPKLLDFGIAKILDEDLIHDSVIPTATAMRLMTPEYASPEQVRGEEITPASDQYSLGVLLYELITGNRPYKFSSRSPHEIARVICEEIPSEPLSGEFGKLITENGNSSLDADFCQKLDRIVLKTLRKNPSERFASVADLAADIKRILGGETVRAESFASEADKIEFPPATASRRKENLTGRANAEKTSPENNSARSAEKKNSMRRKGIKQGFFLMILAFLLIPFTIILTATGIFPAQLSIFVFLAIFLGGIIRIVYALLFQWQSIESNQTVLENNRIFDLSKTQAISPAPPSTEFENKKLTTDGKINGGKSIAVLPFRNLNALSIKGESDHEKFLTIGLADTLITRLSNVRQLVVRPTSSVLRFGNGNADSFTAGEELAVEFVLDGNILKTDKRIRVSVQLLKVADHSVMWAERFDEAFTDVISLEDAISLRVAELIVPRLTSVEIKDLSKRGTDNADAYEAYLKGRFHWNTFTEDGFRQAIVFYKKAVELDPNYALAHAGIADYFMWLGIYGVLSPKNSYPPAKEAAFRAIEIDDRLAEAYSALGFAQLCADFDWKASEKNILRAISINPNYAIAHNWLAIHHYTAARFDEGIRHAEKAIELDPLTYQNYRTLYWGYYFSRQFDKALVEIERAIEKFPLFGVAYFNRSWLLRAMGETEEALRSSEKAVELANGGVFVLLGHAQALAAAGNLAAAEKIIEQVKSQSAYVSDYQIALVYCYAREKEKAFVALERAYAVREGWLVWLAVEPALDILRDDARFDSLLKQINYQNSQENIAPLTAEKYESTLSDEKNNLTVSSHKNRTEVDFKGSKRRIPAPLKYVLSFALIAFAAFFSYHVISHSTISFTSNDDPGETWHSNFVSTMNAKRLTTTGKAQRAVLSPDASLVGYISNDGMRQSLWLRHAVADDARQIVPPDAIYFLDFHFSPDGKYIYYVVSTPIARALYRISTVAGSTPEKVLDGVFNAFAFSPDGQRMIYETYDAVSKRRFLMLADLDENSFPKSVQTLLTLDAPNYFSGSFAFAPDGEKFVYPVSTITGNKEVANLYVFNLITKLSDKLGTHDFNDIFSANWRQNSAEIVINASQSDNSPYQLWLVSYPSGEVSRLTNDFNNYTGINLSSDSNTLVTAKQAQNANLWTAELSESKQNFDSKTKQISNGIDREDGVDGVNWTHDGRILYVARAGEERSVILADPDGSNSRTFPTNASSPSLPSLTPDNRYLIFGDDKEQESNVWRFDLTNGALEKITSANAVTTTISPDGQFIFYSSLLSPTSNKLTVHRKPLAGGDEIQLTDQTSVRPVVSPDGRFVACNYSDLKQTNSIWQIAVLPAEGGAPTHIIKVFPEVYFKSPQIRPLAWSPDNRSLFYVFDKNGVSNIYRVNIENNNSVIQMTHFTSGEIFDFALAPDGKRALLSRGSNSSDIVIFKNSR